MSRAETGAILDDRGRETVLCALGDIPDPGGKGFRIAGRARIFVIRSGDDAYGYVNVCPHQGTTLDWKPDAFLTLDKGLIQCATHGARFEIATGACAGGPCDGRALTPVPLRIEDGRVMLDE